MKKKNISKVTQNSVKEYLYFIWRESQFQTRDENIIIE